MSALETYAADRDAARREEQRHCAEMGEFDEDRADVEPTLGPDDLVPVWPDADTAAQILYGTRPSEIPPAHWDREDEPTPEERDDARVLGSLTSYGRTNSAYAVGAGAFNATSGSPAVLPTIAGLPMEWPSGDTIGDERKRGEVAEYAALRSLARLVAAGRVVADKGPDGLAPTCWSVPSAPFASGARAPEVGAHATGDSITGPGGDVPPPPAGGGHIAEYVVTARHDGSFDMVRKQLGERAEPLTLAGDDPRAAFVRRALSVLMDAWEPVRTPHPDYLRNLMEPVEAGGMGMDETTAMVYASLDVAANDLIDKDAAGTITDEERRALTQLQESLAEFTRGRGEPETAPASEGARGAVLRRVSPPADDWESKRRKLFARCGLYERLLGVVADDVRHATAKVVSNSRTASSSDLDEQEMEAAVEHVEQALVALGYSDAMRDADEQYEARRRERDAMSNPATQRRPSGQVAA